VVRVVTPGTITEDSLLQARTASYLAALAGDKDGYTLGWVDLSSGNFKLQRLDNSARFEEAIYCLHPREILLPETLATELPSSLTDIAITLQPDSLFNPVRGGERLKERFKLKALDSLGELSSSDMAAADALLNYLDLTQKGIMPRLEKPQLIARSEWLAIDPATRRNLELTQSLSGGRKGSLLAAIDRTITAAGGRLLAERIATPLTEGSRIEKRLDQLQLFFEHSELRHRLRDALKSCPDLERALSRICLQRGGPRDLLMVRQSLETVLKLREILEYFQGIPSPLLATIAGGLQVHDALRQELSRALKTEVPMLARDGNFIAVGYHAALDEFRILRDESKRLIAALQQRYAQETGITTLKIKFNNVLGYFVEITPSHEHKITEHFIHRQTMKNALRYSSKELAELEHKLSEAADKALKLELAICAKLLAQIML